MFRRRSQLETVSIDARGVPDLTQLRWPASDYYALHLEAIREDDFPKRVMASWGLIARGVEAMPFLLKMLHSDSADSREDAAGALAWIGTSSPEVVAALLDALRRSVADEERDSILLGLGGLRAREAVPAVAEILRDPTVDGDTRHTAAEALGQIVRRRFDKQPDPIQAALGWLDAHPT
ncbi:MAG TPA: HEAT repeat domain-containing protein [Actinomycetes bacterium]|nr:HEAT repeat domain-containing protein [Actinomycetes bacterium]